MTIIATYSDLLAELTLWLRRPDQTARIPGFVFLTEAAFNRNVRARRKIGRASATISTEFAAVPTNYAGPRTFKLTTGNQPEVRYVSNEQMALLKDAQPTTCTGAPAYYTTVGDEFEFYPVPDAAYTAQLSFYSKIPDLATNSTNWLLSDHPDAYMAGGLWQGFAYLKNADLATQWEAKFMSLVDEINTASIGESMGGVLTMMPSAPGI